MPHFHHAASGSSQAVLFTLILVFTALVYLKGWLPLRSNALKASTGWQALSFLVGLFLIWAAVASPIAALDHELLTVHMLQHLLLMTLAPPLIWLGAPVQPLLHGLPEDGIHASQWASARADVHVLPQPGEDCDFREKNRR